MDAKTSPKMSPWFPMEGVNDLRTLGKALEEFGELVSATSRCLIQGIDEVEPVTGKPNRQWLTEEIADAVCQIGRIVERFGLDKEAIAERAERKDQQMEEWQSILVRPAVPAVKV